MATTYSHSRLSAYENCPLKYKYLYIDRLDRDRRNSIESFLGTVVHHTMEKLYTDLNHEKLSTLEELTEFYDREWVKGWSDDILIVRKEYTADHYRLIGQRCVKDYYQQYHPFNQSRTLGIERQIFVKLPDNRQLTGYIDRLAQHVDGTYEIHDYKTSNSLPGQSYLDHDRQLALYQIGIQQEFRDAARVRLVWHYLAFNKSLTSERDDDQLVELGQRTVELIREIEAATEFPARKSALCSWCEFQDICPLWKHPVRTQDLAPQAFQAEDGVALVNRLAALKQEKQQLAESIESRAGIIDAQIAEVEGQLVELAKREGLEIIQGSQYRARVKVEGKWKAPAKSEPTRKVLEGLLRQHNLWDQVSGLDIYAIDAFMKSPSVDERLSSDLRRLMTYEESSRVSLAKNGTKER